MPKRKLTPKLKSYLKENKFKVKQSDYSGDALAYLLRLRKAAKAAKKKKDKIAKVGKAEIPHDSKMYRIIAASAKLKNVSVAQFIKKYKSEVNDLLKEGRVVLSRETSYALSDINSLPEDKKIYINNIETSKGDALYSLQTLTSTSMRFSNVVAVNYEMYYDYNGNLYMEFPTPDIYDDIVESFEGKTEESIDEEWEEFLKGFEKLVYIKS